MDEIIGMIFPLPKNAINFMFLNNRDVYVKYSSRQPTNKSKIKMKNKMKEDAILYIYQSGGIKSVVAEATIKSFDFLDMDSILNMYSERLMISDDDFKLYAKGRENKKALVLELSDLKRYQKEIKLSEPLTMAGLFLTPEKMKDVFKDV